MSKGIGKGDIVRVATRALMTVRAIHPFIQGTDELRVTRLSREAGRTTVFVRSEHNDLYLLWPEQLEVVRRAPPEPRRAAR